MIKLSLEEIQSAVRSALSEDIGAGDVTSLALIPETALAKARMVTRQPMVVAGLAFAEAAFAALSSGLQIERPGQDGKPVPARSALLAVEGPARAILTAERVALNFVQRLSGIATLTAQYVAAIQGTRAKILDTRKTTPGWRRFEKYAVACGGGQNHRMGLDDLVLIKDNHLAALRHAPPNPVEAAVRLARKSRPHLPVEVEADTLEQARQALAAGADIILLDNMPLEEMRAAVAWIAGKAKTEASGGVSLKTVRAMAETGVDFISVGALTHSAPSVDIGLDFELG